MLPKNQSRPVDGANEEAELNVHKTVTEEVTNYLNIYLASEYSHLQEELDRPLAKYEIDLRVRVAVSEMLTKLTKGFAIALNR